MSRPAELRESTDRYYTAYYRDTLGIPDWSALVPSKDAMKRDKMYDERVVKKS